METVLWALDLIALVYFCFWAVARDSDKPRAKNKGKQPHA